jgi:hypothetical protein
VLDGRGARLFFQNPSATVCGCYIWLGVPKLSAGLNYCTQLGMMLFISGPTAGSTTGVVVSKIFRNGTQVNRTGVLRI